MTGRFERHERMTDSWTTAAQSRREFADLIEGLTEDQLQAPSLCSGWTVQDVAGHVVSFVEMSLPTLMLSMVKGGFNPDKAWKANAAKYGAQPIAGIVTKLRKHAAKPSAMKSFPPELTTTDMAVHAQDVRRALAVPATPSDEVLLEALTFCTTHKKEKMQVPTDHIAGLRLEATDLDWSWGEGKVVSGPAEAILMGINRRDTRSELTGDGVPDLPTT